MFEELYTNVSFELENNNITNDNDCYQAFRQQIKRFFNYYFPKYEYFLGNNDELIKEIAKNSSSDHEQMVDRYNKMIAYLNNNIYKWKTFLKTNQLLDSLAEDMTKKYILSLNNNYNITDAVMDTINSNIERGISINSEEDLKRVLATLFNKYFDRNNPNRFNIFTRKSYNKSNTARKYILSKTEKEVLEEMKKEANFDSSIDNETMKYSIIVSYIDVVGDKIYKAMETENIPANNYRTR